MEQTPSITVAVCLTDATQRAALRAFLDVMDGGAAAAPVKASAPATNTRKPVQQAAAEKPKPEPQETPADDELTLDDLTGRVRKICEGDPSFTKQLKGLLKPYGVDRVSNLDPADWPKFFNDIASF